MNSPLSIAVLLPCFNEGNAIHSVVNAFKNALPESSIYVYDNNSTDDTLAQAQAAGAIVRRERLPGKGNVVSRMFADIEADIYIMADGDGTYDAAAAPGMIDTLVENNLDMVIGSRIDAASSSAQYRPGHRFGNRLLTSVVRRMFRVPILDVLSGYRVMSRRFVKSFPGLARGFEVEVMLSIHAITLSLPMMEVEAQYFDRAPGTQSKLNTFRDGSKILIYIIHLFKDAYPLKFFGVLAALLATSSLGFGVPVIIEYFNTGLVPRFPTAILATGLVLLSAIATTCGLILDSVRRGQTEIRKMLYASMPSLAAILSQRRD